MPNRAHAPAALQWAAAPLPRRARLRKACVHRRMATQQPGAGAFLPWRPRGRRGALCLLPPAAVRCGAAHVTWRTPRPRRRPRCQSLTTARASGRRPSRRAGPRRTSSRTCSCA
eukprot:scaffold1348_cov323-Prasinococcus_capsulatus_cf.AAC.6